MTINGILNNNSSMYKIYILGNGFEITQGALPMETVDVIYSEIESEADLVEYFIELYKKNIFIHVFGNSFNNEQVNNYLIV